jgi:RNA recognition motif-containing protein
MVQRVYLGNLDPRISKEEITDEVSRFGKLTDVWVARNPPGFAFVTFEDERDAHDMMDALVGGEGPLGRVKIEMAKNQGGRQAGPEGIGRNDRGGGGYAGGGYGRGGYGGGPPRRYDDRGRDDRDRRRGHSRSRSRDRDRRRRSRSRSPSDDRRRSKKSSKKYSDESDDDK